MAGLDPSRVAWYGDCEPSLLTNRTVRNYLSCFSQQQWPDVTKLTLLYGILALQQQHPGRILTLQQLKQVVQASAATVVVQRNVPQLQRQILNLQSDLDNVFDRLAIEPLQAASSAQQVAEEPTQQHVAPLDLDNQPVRQQQLRQVQFAEPAEQQLQPAAAAAHGRQRRRHVHHAAVVAPKPSDAWRQGEPSGFSSPSRCHPMRRSQDNQGATNPIYPDWWLAERPAQRPSQQKQPAKAPRQQPRLAYSVPKQQPQQSVVDDDLVTAEYLIVPSSGYGQQQQPLVPGEGPPIMTSTVTPSSITTSYIGQQQGVAPPQQQQQQQARGAAAAAAAKAAPVKPAKGGVSRAARVKQVESKIKQQVAASRAQAAAQQQRRQQLLSSVVATTGISGGGQDRQLQQQQYAVEATCPPAAAAEQFISNPWTSWFLPGAAADLSAGMLASAAPEPLAAPGMSYSDAYAGGGGGSSMSGAGQIELTAAEGDAFELAEASMMTLVPPPEQAAADPAAADLARGILQDITLGLNQFAGSASSASMTAEQAGWFDELAKPPGPPLGFSAAAAGPSGAQEDSAGSATMHRQVAGLHGLAAQQATGKQQRRQAWAADFGHLDSPQLNQVAGSSQGPDGGAAAAARRPQQRHHRQQWSQKWVGDFGHLLGGPRFGRDTAFSHHQQQEEMEAGEGAGPSAAAAQVGRGFMMSPADLEALVAAADQAASHNAAASPAADVKHAGLARTAGLSEGATAPAASTAAGRAGIAMQLTSLLRQWEQQEAAGGEEGSDVGVKLTVAPLAATAQPVASPVAGSSAAAADSVAASREGSPGRVRLHGDVQSTGSPTKQRGQGAADAAWTELLAAATSGEAAESAEGQLEPAAAVAEDYLEGLADTSRMLQQALQQHGSVMRLLAELGSPEPAEEDFAGSSAHTAAWVAATAAVEDAGHAEIEDAELADQ